MSSTFNNTNVELIYNLIVHEEAEEPRPAMYKSMFNKSVKEELKVHKSSHKTFGVSQVPLQSPSDFLRKKSKPVYLKFEKATPREHVFQVPRHFVGSSKTNSEEKNMLKKNIQLAINSSTRTQLPKSVDSNNGNFYTLFSSGLVPQHVFKRNMGRVPRYLSARKSELQRKPKLPAQMPPFISDEERQELIKGLKSNWEKKQQIFELLPVLTDTLPKVRRKLKLEEELKALERDIRLLERHKDIYVFDDTET